MIKIGTIANYNSSLSLLKLLSLIICTVSYFMDIIKNKINNFSN